MFSLENLSLDSIVQNFERFHFVITVTKDNNLHRHFEFLKRKYSAQLITALYLNKKLKEEYFEFLMNEHLNVLVGNWFRKGDSLYQFYPLQKYICRLPNLTRFFFQRCNDEILEHLVKHCPKLVEIDIRNSFVSAEGIKHLYKRKDGMVPCPELKNLFIRSTRVTDMDVEYLIRNLPSLEKIDHEKLPLLLHSIHEENFIKNKKIQEYNLTEIYLKGTSMYNNYADVIKTCLIVCKKLELFSCFITDEKQLDLFTNCQLKKLHMHFSCDHRKFVNIDNFLKITTLRLTSLRIWNAAVSVSALAAYCPLLEELFANDVKFIKNDHFNHTFPNLVKCCFSGLDTPDVKAFRFVLESSPKLQSLSIRFFELIPEIEEEILKWCNNPRAEVIEFVNIDFYIFDQFHFTMKPFLKHILSSSLKTVFLNRCNSPIVDMRYFPNNRPKKKKIYIKHNECQSKIGTSRLLVTMNRRSIFNDRALNLERHLKKEYKCWRIYDSSLDYDMCDMFSDDDWKEFYIGTWDTVFTTPD